MTNPASNFDFQKNLMLYFGLLLFILAVNIDAVSFLMMKWLDMDHGAYNHGLLLLAMCGFLFYRRAQVIVFTHIPSEHIFALTATAILLIFAFLVSLVDIRAPQVVFVYLAAFALLIALWGWQNSRHFIVPVGLLIFALPIWDTFGVALQTVTLHVSHLMVYLSGIPVLKDAYILTVPAGRFEVAPSCSGISYFLAAAALGVFYAELNYQTLKPKIIIFFSLITAAIVANWIRVYLVIIAGQMTNMQHSLVKDHFNLGWIIFGIFFLALLAIFKRKLHDGPSGSGNVRANAEDTNFQPAFWHRKNIITAAVISVLLLVLGGGKWQLLQDSVPDADVAILSDALRVEVPPAKVGSFFQGAQQRYYKLDVNGASVSVTHAYYPFQAQNSELINDLNRIYDSELWILSDSKTVQIKNHKMRELVIKSKYSSNEYLLWYWYRVAGKHTISTLEAKLYQLLGILQQNRQADVFILAGKKADASAYEKVLQLISQDNEKII